jgi:hypothetical protein
MGMIASVVTSQNWEKNPSFLPQFLLFIFLFSQICDVAQVAISS